MVLSAFIESSVAMPCGVPRSMASAAIESAICVYCWTVTSGLYWPSFTRLSGMATSKAPAIPPVALTVAQKAFCPPTSAGAVAANGPVSSSMMPK